MGTTRARRFPCLLGLLCLLGWTGGCTRENPAFCTADADCVDPRFSRCDPDLHTCVPGGEGEEPGADADGGQDGRDDGPADADGGDLARIGLFVDIAACTGSGDGSQARPFCTIGEALDAAQPGDTVWIAAGTYQESLNLSTDLTLAGAPGARVSSATCPAVTVMNGARVVLRELELTSLGTGASGLLQVVGGASLDGAQLVLGPSSCVGLRCSQADCALDRARVRGNQGGGLDLGQGLHAVTNTLVLENGALGQVGGVRLNLPAPGSRFAFNTVAFNASQGALASGLTCQTEAGADSCILWGNSGGDVSANCTVDHSDVSQAPGSYAGTGNQNADPQFVDEGAGDLHLRAGSACIDAANPSPGEVPAHDLDGQARPLGARADQGADEAG